MIYVNLTELMVLNRAEIKKVHVVDCNHLEEGFISSLIGALIIL